MLPPGSPLMLRTALTHAPRLVAPWLAGLYCRLSRPSPTRRRVFAHPRLQLRQVHSKLAGESSSSWPLTRPTSRLRVEPHGAQTGSPGGAVGNVAGFVAPGLTTPPSLAQANSSGPSPSWFSSSSSSSSVTIPAMSSSLASSSSM